MTAKFTIVDAIGVFCLIGAVFALFIWALTPNKRPARTQMKTQAEPELIPGYLTLHQAMEGVLILGGTGSGKTTGPGAEIAYALLRKEIVYVRTTRHLRVDR